MGRCIDHLLGKIAFLDVWAVVCAVHHFAMRIFLACIIVVILFFRCSPENEGNLHFEKLPCEYAENPICTRIHIPGSDIASLQVDGRTVTDESLLKSLGYRDEYHMLEVPSGE
jgi:hypothetical protein